MARDSKGRFLKGGRRRRSSSKALTRRTSSSPARRGRRRRGGGGGGGGKLTLSTLGPPIAAGAVLGYIVKRGGSSGFAASVIELAKKVPGQKTFGTAPAIGVMALAVDRFLYRHRYLRLLGMAGIVVGAYDAGGKQDLRWLGDVGDPDDGMVAR